MFNVYLLTLIPQTPESTAKVEKAEPWQDMYRRPF